MISKSMIFSLKFFIYSHTLFDVEKNFMKEIINA